MTQIIDAVEATQMVYSNFISKMLLGGLVRLVHCRECDSLILAVRTAYSPHEENMNATGSYMNLPAVSCHYVSNKRYKQNSTRLSL